MHLHEVWPLGLAGNSSCYVSMSRISAKVGVLSLTGYRALERKQRSRRQSILSSGRGSRGGSLDVETTFRIFALQSRSVFVISAFKSAPFFLLTVFRPIIPNRQHFVTG